MKSVTRMLMMLLLLLTVSECGSSPVVGYEGQNVTLSCKHDIKYRNPWPICWGRGDLPLLGCNNQLISTDGHKVKERLSSRYQLLGRLDEGDVSLTILNLTDSDAGQYGCRVDIPGWFNDEKHHIDLIIKEALPTKTITVLTTWRGSDVTSNGPTESTVTQIQETGSTPVKQQEQQVNSLLSIIGNAVRAFFITFIPTTLLTAAYVSKKRQSATVLRTNSRTETGRRLNQSVEEEEDSPV